jgi:hypothetical protein
MKAMQGMVAVLALGLATGAFARKPDVDNIKHWQAPAFTIYAADTSVARTVAAQVAPIERVLSTLLAKEPQATGLPLLIYIASDSVWHRYLRPSLSISAEYVPARFSNYIVMASTQQKIWAREAINHEYAHYFLRSQFSGEIPLWFDEGLAGIASGTDLWSKQVRVGTPWGQVGVWLPLEKVLRVDKKSPEYLGSLTAAFHYQSWALVHWGLIHDRNFGAQIFGYLNAINRGVPIDDAVHGSFGMSVAELDRAVAGYTKRGSFSIAKFPFEWPEVLKLDAGRRIPELESLELLARIMLDTGLNPTRVGEVIAAAKQLAPQSPSVRVLELRLAVRDGSDADVEEAWQQLVPQNQEPLVARSVGLALFERVRAELTGEIPPGHALDAHARRAFDLLARGDHAMPLDAESAWAFAVLSAHLGLEAEFALQRLQIAADAVPRNGDLSMAAALLHERLGQPGHMREQLANTSRYSRSARQNAWAKQRLERLGLQQEQQ